MYNLPSYEEMQVRHGMGARGGPEVTGVHALGPEGEEQAAIRLVMRQKARLKRCV